MSRFGRTQSALIVEPLIVIGDNDLPSLAGGDLPVGKEK